MFLILSRRVQLLFLQSMVGSNAVMAKPIRALELHYPMIQFLIIDLIQLRTDGIKAISPGFSSGKQVIKAADSGNCSRVCLIYSRQQKIKSVCP